MEDVTHFLLDLEDMEITFDVTPAQLWQAGGGQHVKISVIETREFELAGSDLRTSYEASHRVDVYQRSSAGRGRSHEPPDVEDLDMFGHRISAHPTKAIGARSLLAPEGGVCIPAAADATAVTHDPAAGSRSDSMEMGRKPGPSACFYF
ncbi:hypothetical protein CNYM01_08097 [Colletotrichum nymphaeae SA-01]|uniref:Uncharacterized protein n=1 Tax=Colletotrichum nymphaeae SA-01 TaxID=1460502 RepID=A0A135T9Q3_9PEZI|nr:hypothetical protein CNYM01_08097 [Colletotrichum nymphaeae SA-01]